MEMDGKPLRTLLVEDNAGDARLIREMLKEASTARFELVQVERLDAALKCVKQTSFDVALLDLGLPDSRGLDSFDRLRSQAPAVPVVVLTGLDDQELAVKAVRAGAQDYLVKGKFDGDLLARCMRYAIERERAEEALRESEERFRKVFEEGPVGMALVGSDHRLIEVNPALCGLLGYSERELTGMRFADITHPEDIERDARSAEQLFKGEIPSYSLEKRYVRKDGEQIWAHLTASLIRGKDGTAEYGLGIVEDISERKRAEEGLRRARDELETRVEERTAELAAINERLQAELTERKRVEEALRLDEARLAALVRLNEMTEAPLQQVADFVLEEGVRLTGSQYGFLGFMSDDESVQNVYTWSGDAMKECRMVDKPTAFPVAEAGLWGEVVRQRKPILVNDYSALQTWKKGYPEGHVHISRFLGVPVFDGGRIVAVAAVANKEEEYQEGDVRQLTLLMDSMWRLVQRQQAEAAVRESRRFLQTIIDDIPEALMVIDRDHRIILANRAVREMAGGADPVSSGLTCYQAYHHRDSPCQEEEYPCPLKQVISAKSPVRVTHTHFAADGSEILVEVFAAPIFDEAGEVVQIIQACRDITARVRAEEQARQRQAELAHVARLNMVGELASGLAHELNQPLCAILSSTQACRRLVRSGRVDSEELGDAMDEVSAQAERAGEIIRRLRNFVRKQQPRQVPVDINDIVREAAAFIEADARDSAVMMQFELADQAPPVLADGIQIQQVVLNLLRNAVEAMKNIESAKRVITLRSSLFGADAVEVAIRDTGAGLSADAFERMFEPFYTTKSSGIGVGLSISRSIIEAHGGRLWATRNPDQGVTFRFTLPTTSGASDHEVQTDRLRCG